MKYIAFIAWMLMTPIICIGTFLFCFGLYARAWFELGNNILKSK